MMTLRHNVLARAQAGPAIDALASWTPPDRPQRGVHPGDLGWQMRFPHARIHLWTAGDEPVAVGLIDENSCYFGLAPGFDGSALLPYVEQLGVTSCDGLDALESVGWQRSTDPWYYLYRDTAPRPAQTAGPGTAVVVTSADAPDRVSAQRAAWDKSVFTIERWQDMMSSPAADRCVDILVRDHDGVPVASATGWLAGPGRCALLEPVGTHRDHRGKGYGRQAVLAACAALLDRGASGVSVLTPSVNAGAVALYQSAGLEITGEERALSVPRS
jgi:ribosomal protein S18 acetylase RimI-like enzyme